MSREEFADAVNEAITELFAHLENRQHLYVNSRWVGILERGERRWTFEERRAALRKVTGAANDDELGLYPPRDRIDDRDDPGVGGEPRRLISFIDRPGLPRPRGDAGEQAAPSVLVGLEFAADWHGGLGVAGDLWREDLRQRHELQQIQFNATAFLAAALRWLTSSLDERPDGNGERLIGAADIETVRRMTSTYRALDNQFGGGHIRDSLVRFLNGDVADLIRGRFDVTTGRQLFSAVAETTQLAGWASYDAGMHGLAQRYLIQALRLAAGAGDRALGAEILAAMSHQAAFLGASAEAVDLARAAGHAAAKAGVAAIEAESAVLEAHGHAAGGDERACASALSRAEAIFDKADRVSEPQWIGYFDESYLAARFGHCFTALGRGDIAARFAGRSLDMDGRQYARGRQFNLVLLAVAHIQNGEPEEAARVGIDAAAAAETLNSSRARDYLSDLADRLSKHVGLPAVRDFTERARPVLGRG